MSLPENIFKIIKEKKCPLYEKGDEFELSDHVFLTSNNKPTCIILVMDITEFLLDYKDFEAQPGINSVNFFYCSGCTGTVRLEYAEKTEAQLVSFESFEDKAENIGAITNLLSNFSFFQTIDESELNDLIPLLKVKRVVGGEYIIKKGDSGRNLFIILTGKVEVLGDDGIRIAFLEKGEVFGEMSLISGDPSGADVKVAEPSIILYLNGQHFRRILNKLPSLQMYFARLLARRLAKTNIEMSEEFGSGMVGRLSEMPPGELFQTLNLNNKTGILTMDLSKGTAELSFKDGGVIRAEYGDLENKEAFYEVLKEKDGRFKFHPGLSQEEMECSEIEDFMWLLMEGLNKIDEERMVTE
ncbi:MAG: cyclic nucleotide-binding domain-containing protein [Desulfobacteraceae bacterium]|nr:cyclic nucleotide-binding domain-containing protein [Desulfobacteraceae bacterium]